MSSPKIFGALGLGLLLASPAWAEESADSIAKRALDNNVFSTANARAELALDVSKDGKVVRQRRISTKIKRNEGEVRSYIEFSAPADVAGTKFLSIEKKGEAAEQYLYLPAFKKVKRVVGSQRSDSFMGTDFSYDDLDGRDPELATWKSRADETLGGQECWVVEGQTKRPDEDPYERVVIWVHKKHLLPMKMDFYAKGGAEVVKRLTVRKLEKKDERWVATDSVMATPKKGTETRISLLAVDFTKEIPEAELTKAVLER